MCYTGILQYQLESGVTASKNSMKYFKFCSENQVSVICNTIYSSLFYNSVDPVEVFKFTSFRIW